MSKGITSLTGFVRKVEDLKANASGTLYFRGHEDSSFNIIPSIFRSEKLRKNENRMLRHLTAELPDLFSSDWSTFDNLVRAQHYGLPTRLLDVSSNPLVALFFACWKAPKKTGEVIAFEVEGLSERFAESDTVSCVANLCHLSEDERDELADVCGNLAANFDAEHFDASRENAIEELNRHPVCRRLVQFVRGEKPYFQNRIWFDDLWDIHAVIPRKNNQRIVAQSGAFLLFGLHDKFDAIFAANIKIHRMNINASMKNDIVAALDAMGINDNGIFPEPERVAASIKRRYA